MSFDVSQLNFDDIKENIITYMSAQSEFADFDFTGSAINTLIDVLAYTTHYMSVHANMAINEVFLDSALLRHNAVARAKEISYIPSQPAGAAAELVLVLDLTAEPSPPTTLEVPKGTIFTATNTDSQAVQFVSYDVTQMVDTGIAADTTATKILSGSINVVEGAYGEQEFLVSSNTDETYIIQQPDISTNNLQVAVRETAAATIQTLYEPVSNLMEVTSESEVYFHNEVNGNQVELYFGNGQIGLQLATGNVITATYISNNGESGNGLTVDTLSHGIDIYSVDAFYVAGATVSSGGHDRETLSSIKKLAPLDYQRQNRVVTISDYRTTVLANYPNVQAINTWGGEDNVPPSYGKVFISVKPNSGDTISDATAANIIENTLKKFNVVGIVPEIVDPAYVYISPTVEVEYNREQTTLQQAEVESLLTTTITEFFDEQLYDFDSMFKYSRFLTAMDEASVAINNSIATVLLYKTFSFITEDLTYNYTFSNEITAGTLISSLWTDKYAQTRYLADDGSGVIWEYVDGIIIDDSVGTVDYDTGEFEMINYDAKVSSATAIKIKATPLTNNVDVTHNNLLVLGDVSVTATAKI